MTTLPVLRRSAVQTAQSCLYRYKKLWVDSVPDQSDYALRGIAFHSCAHRYILRLKEQNLPSDAEEAKFAFTEGIAAALTPSHLVPEVRQIFFRWAESFGLDLEAFVAAEEHQMGKNQQTFTPDLVYAHQDVLTIVDFKTYWSSFTETQLRNDFQSRWYVYNAMRIWPNFPNYRFVHSYVRFGTTVSVDFKSSDFSTFADEVDAVAATITEAQERNEWPATAGPECSYCELKCPLADSPAILPKRFTLPEQAKFVASRIMAVDQELKAWKKALKQYCAANGPVDVQGVEWNNREVIQRSYPIDDVLRILRERNVFGAFDQSSGLTISHSALSKLIKAFPQLAEDLLPFQQSKSTYRFSARKPGGDDEEDE